MQVFITASSGRAKSSLGFLSLLIVVFLFASCTSSSPEDPGAAGGADRPQVDPDGDSPDRLATVGSIFDDRVNLGLERPPSYRPDEVVLTDQSAVIVSDLLYDGLTEAVGGAGELRPGLALDWRSDDAFVEWRFNLDPDAGVTADDVVDSLTSLVANRGGRAGIAAIVAADIARVSATDASTVVIELNGPSAGLPWVLSGLPYSIVGESGAFTGDYEVISDDTNGMILTRRPERNPAASVSPEEIVITWAASSQGALALLAAGLVDAAIVPPDVAADGSVGLDGIGADMGLIVTTSAVRFYVLNSQAEALTDLTTREAVLSSVDRGGLLELGVERDGSAIDGLLGPTMTGYRPHACGAVCNDGEAVADGGVLNELQLQISFAGDEQRVTAAAIASQLSDAGVLAEPGELPADDLARAIVQGETDMFAFGWVAPATSGDSVLPPLLAVDSPANIAKIASPEVAELLDEAAVTGDDEARWDLLDQAHRAALAEALILPVAGSTSIMVTQPEVRGMAVRADGSIDLDSTQ